MITVQGLTKNYGPTRALSGVNFSVSKGEVVGFLGPNGAGKTTTMKILTGYLMPDDGKAEVAGYDVVESPVEVKRRIGYLPESTPLYTEMWVREYLHFIADVREIPKSNRAAAMDRVVQICSLGDVLYKQIGELSKGFRQRVGLAQAMLHDPEILILDEPTVGLDPNQIAEIRDLIRKLGSEKTVILSTHILSEVQATCSRVLIVSGGKLVADGSVSDLTSEKAGEIVHVTWRAPIAQAETAIQSLSSIAGIQEKISEGGKCSFVLRSKGGDQACEDLFELAVSKGWKISELRRDSATLEDVFRRMTTEGQL